MLEYFERLRQVSRRYKAVKVIDFGSAREKENVQDCPIIINCAVTSTCAPELHSLRKDERLNLLKTDGCLQFWDNSGRFVDVVITRGCLWLWSTKKLKILKFGTRVERGDRPLLPDDCPSYLRFIVASSWSGDPLIRPQFERICRLPQIAELLLSGIIK